MVRVMCGDSEPPTEFYEIGLTTVRGLGRTEYRVIEIHGWWDEEKRKSLNTTDTLNPELGEGYSNFVEARERFNTQKKHRARNGFIHLLRLDIPSGREIYERLSPE